MALVTGEKFNRFSMLRLNEEGRFYDVGVSSGVMVVEAQNLSAYLRKKIVLSDGVTDVFVWVHGWQNDDARAVRTARRFFANLERVLTENSDRYPRLGKCIPDFVAVHWPSMSGATPRGYKRIRDRAVKMTTEGEAEFFLASVLGYLDAKNERRPRKGVLRGRQGFCIHCLGHSFGGRFLTAAVKASATPTERTRKLLAAARRNTGFDFTVDSLCVLQMAAGATAFKSEFEELLGAAPLSGPIVLTHSNADRALCWWHCMTEEEVGIGCNGAREPSDRIGRLYLRPCTEPYSDTDFESDITNVDASRLFTKGDWIVGAHSDFFHDETFHLIASVVEQAR